MSDDLAGGTATQTQTETSIVNPDGSFVENWTEKYGEENQAHLKRYKDFDALVNSHIATKSKFGRDPDTLIQIPQDDSPDEVKAAFYKAGGKPDTVDEYEYKLPKELAEKVEVNEERLTAFKKFAHEKLHLSKAEFVEALNFYFTDIAESIGKYDTIFNEQQKEEIEKGQAELKSPKVWGNDYDNRVLRANAILRKYGGEDAVASFNAQNSPLMAKFLDNIAGAMSEATIKGLGPSTGPSSADTKAKIAEIRSRMDKIVQENPVNFKANAEYKSLTAQKTELYKQMNKK